MEQKFEVIPSAEVRLEGRRAIRGDVVNDWGLQLRWQVSRNGQVIATPPARATADYEHPDATPGTYKLVLQMWKYVDYRKTPEGEFINSQFVNISNELEYTI